MNKKTTFLLDGDGHSVPVKYIDPIDLDRHMMVERVLGMVLFHQKVLRKLKRQVVDLVGEYLESVADQYSEKWRGNAALMNFPQTKMVDVKVQQRIAFDERLNIAKSKIDKCLEKWSKNAKHELRALVMRAFNVDKSGTVDTKQILDLRKLKFDDEEWNEAMKLIDDSLMTVGSKEYINFRVRDDARGKWETISLNFSAVEVWEEQQDG
ncbi:MAG: DUF3164 family protein [Candidatus Ratteibacteria bacterium]